MQKRSGFHAILEAKCPRCRKGEIFSHSLTSIDKFAILENKCNICGLEYEVEPGFFQGAMYINYAFSIAIITLVGIVLNILMNDPPIWIYIVFIALLLLLFLPVIYRYSRVIYLHLFGGVKYQEHPNK